MKIALIGTGRMGSAIEQKALADGDEVVLKVNRENRAEISPALLQKSDVAIEFTEPGSAVTNLLWCLDNGVPVVCGTTGWNNELEGVYRRFKEENGSLIVSSNFSIGVNLLFRLNQQLAAWMNNHREYHPDITETHHTRKLDKPGGTALTLVSQVLDTSERFRSWALIEEGRTLQEDMIPVTAHRTGDVVGEHQVRWTSPVDELSISHKAFTRDGFAAGALLAARWIADKKGVYTMADVLFGR